MAEAPIFPSIPPSPEPPVTQPIVESPTRQFQAGFETQLGSGNSFEVEYQRQFEYLFEEFEISDGIFLPMGGYDFDRIRGNYRFGPQRRMSAWITASTDAAPALDTVGRRHRWLAPA